MPGGWASTARRTRGPVPATTRSETRAPARRCRSACSTIKVTARVKYRSLPPTLVVIAPSTATATSSRVAYRSAILQRIASSETEREVPATASSGSLSSVRSAEMSISSEMAKLIRCSASRYSGVDRCRRRTLSISPAAAESGVRISCATAAANDCRSLGAVAAPGGNSAMLAVLRRDGVAGGQVSFLVGLGEKEVEAVGGGKRRAPMRTAKTLRTAKVAVNGVFAGEDSGRSSGRHRRRGERLEPERVPDADRGLRHLADEAAAGGQRARSRADEQFAAGAILPAIARREGKVLADVVVLRLQRDLHDRRDVHHGVRGGEVDVDPAGRQIDRVRFVARVDLEMGARPEDQIHPRDERVAVIEAAAGH